jgi:hypothetical protein
MNRRELLQRLTGSVAAAIGAPVIAEVLDAPADPRRALIVLRPTGKRLSMEQCVRLREHWMSATAGTAFADVKTVVLDSVDVELRQL